MRRSGLSDGQFIPVTFFDVSALREMFQAHVFALLVKERMVSAELIDRMKSWRHSGFHAFAGDEIPDIDDAVRVGIYMVRGPAADVAREVVEFLAARGFI